jgi:predicted transcriptional regulator of viral defense system
MQQKITSKTLGPVSAQLINKLQQVGKVVFTIEDVIEIYNQTRSNTIDLLRALTKRGVIVRIKSGVYQILQFGQENIQLSNWPIIAHHLINQNDNYFISYYSAMRIYGMTNHPLLDVYITTPKRYRVKKIQNITYNFIYSKREHLSFSDF